MVKSRCAAASCFLLFASLLFIAGSVVLQTYAQAEDEAWMQPVNLSQTGAATNPVLVVGADGVYHVFWQDKFEGFVYSSGDGVEWSPGQAVRLPFSEPPFNDPPFDEKTVLGYAGLYAPQLLVDSSNQIHGIWTDVIGRLWYSQAAVAELTTPESWSVPVQLAPAVIAQSIAADADGRLHLGYIRLSSSEGFPAGVYYRQSADGGDTWSEATLLYESKYFQTLAAGQATIQIEVDEAVGIHLVWDNPPLETVMTTHSPDDVITWGEPREVDRRRAEDAPSAPGPAKINMLIHNGDVHLTWQAQHEEATCSQYHQWSDNGGLTWYPRQIVFADAQGCPTGRRFIEGNNGLLLLLTEIGSNVYLQAWDGTQWGQPTLQPPLSRPIDPSTYRPIDLGCRQPVSYGDNMLLVVGCGKGNAEDIWALSRPVGTLEDWLPLPTPTPIWSQPSAVAQSALRLLPSELVVDDEGGIHVFWVERSNTVANSLESSINYASWKESQWSAPLAIQSSPGDRADHLSAALDHQRGRLLIVYDSGLTGEVYFSRADVERASFPREWSLPQRIPSMRSVSNEPDILVDGQGEIFVAYAIPLDEDRGVYVTKSEDGGDTWSDPVLVFDAAMAGWTKSGHHPGNGHSQALGILDHLVEKNVSM